MKSTGILAAAAAAVFAPQLASAHGFVTGVKVNGVWTAGADPVWYYYPAGQAPATAGWNALNQDIGFVAPDAYGTSDIACHKSATVGKNFVDVKAGDTVTFYWNGWADSHKGPAINYIAPFGTSAGSLKWSKISQSSIVSGKTWVTDQMLTNNYTLSTVIPKNLKAGDYVIRHEIIALHGAQSVGGAQNYPQCLNLRVSGSGTVAPTNGVPGTSLYKKDEVGIVFNLYTDYTSYPYPGPALWTAAN
ncbi:lytic polysaccharide monooxygenase [Xylariaceae sp. FL0594]|nr:lytic polysaccharide monooxygenase [Xylariaceae sp. FL0594]